MRNEGSAIQVEIFEYADDPDAASASLNGIWADAAYGDAGANDLAGHAAGRAQVSPVEARLRLEFEGLLVEQARKAFESGRERGRLEGRATEHEAQAAALSAAAELRTQQVHQLLGAWMIERDRYMHAVEHEVVALALAAAARILRRESALDPLLLTGAVRVALGQLSASTEVKVCVPAAELGLWTAALALIPNLVRKPAVVAGEGMQLGDCRIESGLGSVDVGVCAQLDEIERGFFDRAGDLPIGDRPTRDRLTRDRHLGSQFAGSQFADPQSGRSDSAETPAGFKEAAGAAASPATSRTMELET